MPTEAKVVAVAEVKKLFESNNVFSLYNNIVKKPARK